MERIKEVLLNIGGSIIMGLIIIGSIIFAANIPDSADQTAYQTDCAKLVELRREYSELHEFQNSRAEELRKEIKSLERRCKGY